MRTLTFFTLSILACACGLESGEIPDASSGGSGAVGGTSGIGGVGGGGAVGGTSGVGGVGGSGAVGGIGGTGAGVGGIGGTSGVGGIGGTSGIGGVGGVGGTSGTGGDTGVPECGTASDCRLQNDCCNCEAIPQDAPPQPSCLIACLQNHCEALGVSAVACVAGRCVLDINCNQNDASCDAIPPQCPAGQTASIRGACYGGCIPVRECREVTSCSDCGANDACVSYDFAQGPELHCTDVPARCNGTPSCACMSSSVCTSPFNLCGDTTGGVNCVCPTC